MTESNSRATLTAFISYSHEDAALVTNLFHLLRSIGSVFLTHSRFCLETRRRRIESAQECAVKFSCSGASMPRGRRKYVGVSTFALALKKRIVPVLIDFAHLPPELDALQRVDLSSMLNHHIGVHMPHNKLGPFLHELFFEEHVKWMLHCAEHSFL